MSLKARLYIASVIVLGSFALLHGLYGWSTPDLLKFSCYLALAIPASCLKVSLPGISGTMSVLFMFLLAGIVELGLPETMAIGAVCVIVQSFWRAKKRVRAIHVVFSIATLTLTIEASNAMFRAVHPIPDPFRLAITASVYFFVNTVPIAIVIALTEGKSLRQVWTTCYFWSFPYYLVGAALVSVFNYTNRHLDWPMAILILPVMYVIYRSYQLYLSQLQTERGRAEAERKHSEEVAELHGQTMHALSSLRVSEERLRIAVEAASIGTWDYNPITGELHWDERCKAAFGLAPDAEVSHEIFLSLIHPEDRTATDEAVLFALDPGRDGRYSADYRTVGFRDEIMREVHSEGRAFFGEVDGQMRAIRFIGTVQDMTAQKRNEAALRRANEDLRQFAYAAAHDLQEPLRNIATSLGLIKHVQEGSFGDEAEKLVQESIGGAQRLIRMVKDLLAFTKVASENGRNAELRDANEIMRQVLSDLSLTVSESHSHVTVETLPWVRVEPTHLSQLFQNLIGNAIKYRSANRSPQIRISAARDGAEWLFSVSDNGIGFEPRHAGRIFGVFKRLHAKDQYPGTGIGLAVCSRIVALYGGRIWAESQPDIGSTFKFTIPASKGKNYDYSRLSTSSEGAISRRQSA